MRTRGRTAARVRLVCVQWNKAGDVDGARHRAGGSALLPLCAFLIFLLCRASPFHVC